MALSQKYPIISSQHQTESLELSKKELFIQSFQSLAFFAKKPLVAFLFSHKWSNVAASIFSLYTSDAMAITLE